MREPSASQLALAEKCQHPWTSGIRWPWEEQSGFAVFGERTHTGCEALSNDDVCYPAAYAGLTAAEVVKLDGCVESARWWLEGRRGLRCAEIDLRYHVPTGKVRRAGPEEQRTKRPGEWTSRLDLVLDAPNAIHVVDWKTGRQEHTSSTAENPQVRLGALAAARHFGASRVVAHLVYLEPGDFWDDTVEFDGLDLALIEHDMRDLRKRLTAGPTPPVPGPWCTQSWCKLRGTCSATKAALAAVFPLEQPLTVQIRDDAHARYILERIPGAQAALDAVTAAVREYARTRPVPVGDGKVYGWRKTSRRDVRVDTSAQLEALRGVLGAATSAAVKVETTTSLEAIKNAAQQLAGGPGARGQGAIVTRALEALEAVGGVVTKEYEKPEVFKPKETA